MRKKEIKLIVIDDNIEDLIVILRQSPDFKEKYKPYEEKKINDLSIISFKGDNEDIRVQIDFLDFAIQEKMSFSEVKELVLNIINRNSYDIILLDYYLRKQFDPGEDDESAINRGLNMINDLAKLFPNIPIVVISNIASIGDADPKEIRKYATKFIDKKDLSKYLNKFENFEETLIKNIALKIAGKTNHENQLPIILKYFPLRKYLLIKGSISNCKLDYLRNLKIKISYIRAHYPYKNGSPTQDMTKSYPRLLLKPYKLNLEKTGIIQRILVQPIFKGKIINQTLIQRHLTDDNKPDYFDYIKNYIYILGYRLTY